MRRGHGWLTSFCSLSRLGTSPIHSSLCLTKWIGVARNFFFPSVPFLLLSLVTRKKENKRRHGRTNHSGLFTKRKFPQPPKYNPSTEPCALSYVWGMALPNVIVLYHNPTGHILTRSDVNIAGKGDEDPSISGLSALPLNLLVDGAKSSLAYLTWQQGNKLAPQTLLYDWKLTGKPKFEVCPQHLVWISGWTGVFK